MSNDARAARNAWIWTWIVAVVPFLGFWFTGLFDLDEGFYGAVIREMLATGDWIVPSIGGLPWFEKPILMYWLSAPFVWLFGEAVGPRFSSVLCSLGTMALVAWFLRRHFSDFAARRAVLILATCFLFVAVGRMLLADPSLVLAQTAAFVFFAESMISHRRWRVASGAALGFAVLAKGPVSVAFFIAIVATLWWTRPDDRPLLKGQWLGFLAAFLAVVASWYVPAYLSEPKAFVEIFILQQNVERLLGGDVAHRVPAWSYLPYYFIILGIAFAPWWWHALKEWKNRSDDTHAQSLSMSLLKGWAVAVLVLFTLGGSKLPHYILPAVIPLAMIAAVRLGRFDAVKSHPLAGPSLSMGAAVLLSWAVNGFQLLYYHNSGQAMAHSLVRTALDQKLPLATYQLRARERNVAVTTRIQETALPSLNFYYGGQPKEFETMEQVMANEQPYYLLTRRFRIPKAERDAAKLRGVELIRVNEIQTTDFYELYWVGKPGTYVAPKSNLPGSNMGRVGGHDHGKEGMKAPITP